ncbi:MAG: ribosomal protein S18-alanine N-acetyltransferase [Desulfurococcales archaeon]|nr:ribosomal protein S18-alanine N-acetyltransferase [Desulfurococcales archaeon]
MAAGALIREAKEEDLLRIIHINMVSLREHYPEYFWRDHLRYWGKAFLVAEVDGDVVGYVMTRVERSIGYLSRLLPKKVGHIVSIAVHPDYRRRGLGTKLMSEAERRLKEVYGVKEIYLEVRVSNEPAIKLYEKLGYEKVRRVKYYYLDGEDAWIMAKEV